MHDTTEGKILAIVCLIIGIALLGGVYWMTKDSNSDLDPQCLEENRQIAREAGHSPEAKIKLKDCRKERMNK